VYFDFSGNGFATATGFPSNGDGFLAIDLNGNGVIDNGTELFGNQTGAANGFEVLAAYDTDGDGKITAADARFRDLRVWIDANQNGVSEANELHTLDEPGITSIDTAFNDASNSTSGNAIRETATFTQNGKTYNVADVYFSTDKLNTTYVKDYALDANVLFLPTARGYGTLADLHIAMSLDNAGDNSLQSQVRNFTAGDFGQALAGDKSAALNAILFRWANVSPSDRGGSIDGQALTFLERMMGKAPACIMLFIRLFSSVSTIRSRGHDENVLKWIFVVLLSAFAVAAIAGTAFLSSESLSREEKQMTQEIESLPFNERISLSKIGPLGNYNTLCILRPYSIGGGEVSEKSFSRIFGGVDYSIYKGEIFHRYGSSDTGQLGIYPVEDNKLSGSFRVMLRDINVYSIDGCYKAKSVCLRKSIKKDSKIRRLLILIFVYPPKKNRRNNAINNCFK